jgi:hypothetical protein
MTRSFQCSIQRKSVVQEDEIDRALEDSPPVSVGVGKHTWSDRRAKSMGLPPRFKLPPLLDGLLNDHVYTSGRMGSNQSKTRYLIARRGTKRTPSLAPSPSPGPSPSRRIPDRRHEVLRFRVLVIGRANAGKTSILQRVCDTTKSPTIFRGEEEVVRGTNFVYKCDLITNQAKLNPSMDVSNTSIPLHLPLNAVSARRAHNRR